MWLITSHKKGIASTQIAKDLKVTQKTGWFILHRLRHAARTQSFNAPLDGHVETRPRWAAMPITVSAKHLHRYVSESAWRFFGEGQRMNEIMADANGHSATRT